LTPDIGTAKDAKKQLLPLLGVLAFVMDPILLGGVL
jgi:hypothetical protein